MDYRAASGGRKRNGLKPERHVALRPMRIDVCPEAVVHRSRFTHQIGEMAVQYRELRNSFIRGPFSISVRKSAETSPGSIGSSFAVDQNRLWGISEKSQQSP